jgi:hypothetical protein
MSHRRSIPRMQCFMSMISGGIIYLFMIYFLLGLNFVIDHVAAHSFTRISTSRQKLCIEVPRGGTIGSDDPFDEVEAKIISKEINEDKTTKKEYNGARVWPSLFDIADDIKSDVSSGVDSDTLGGNRSSFESGRGGALVKEKSKRFSRWLSPLDINRVAPSFARLMRDNVADLDVSDSSRRHSTGESSTVGYAQSIWVDTWTGNLPDDDQDNGEVQPDELEPTLVTDDVVEGRVAVDSNHLESDSTRVNVEKKVTEKNLESRQTQEVNDAILDNDGTASIPANDFMEGSQQNSEVPFENTTQQESSDQQGSRLAMIGNERIIVSDAETGEAESFVSMNLYAQLRSVRKATARVTGLHGFISGKYHTQSIATPLALNDVQNKFDRRRLDAIDRAKKNLERLSDLAASKKRKQFFAWGKSSEQLLNDLLPVEENSQKTREEFMLLEGRRQERVKEIDRQIQIGQFRLFQLACEKDVLQQRPNPLWNYTVEEEDDMLLNESNVFEPRVIASRQFNFPPPDIVEDYLEMLFSTGRIVKMNHSHLWLQNVVDDDDDEDELTMPKFYNTNIGRKNGQVNGDSQSGSWFLRNGLGEKIGETAETSAYKAVCQSVMSILARSLSALHGINVMGFSDIRLFTEQTPNLPPLSAAMLPGTNGISNYAQETIHDVVRRGAKKRSKKRNDKRRAYGGSFIQRDAVVETLLSQCQIAAPLLKMFPLAWQRAILVNIVTLITAIVADFCDGIEFRILGHRLSFTFTPITEDDLLRGLINDNFMNERRSHPEQFEAAVIATAAEVGNNLKFLDRWHERALGGGILRTQIATLIARLVLSLVDDILHGAKINLWTAHAGGPRLTAGLEYHAEISSNSNDTI